MVVYRSIPTSNRNNSIRAAFALELYIVLFLHQTATQTGRYIRRSKLYIVLFLHQTATSSSVILLWFRCISFYSYIKPQLFPTFSALVSGCISFYSYIKPQRWHHAEQRR